MNIIPFQKGLNVQESKHKLQKLSPLLPLMEKLSPLLILMENLSPLLILMEKLSPLLILMEFQVRVYFQHNFNDSKPPWLIYCG